MLTRTLLITLLLTTAPFLSTVVFSQEALVLLEDPTPAELCPSCTSVIFLLKQSKPPVQISEAPQVELISLSGDRKNAQGFTADWIGEQKPRAIKITVNVKELVRSGTYDVYLNLQPKSNADAPRLKVQILRPAPKIAPIPKLILDRTYWFIWWETDTHPELFLHEVSKKSNITNLIINKVGNASIGTRPIGGTLQLSNAPRDVTAGENKKIEYALANDFGLGTASGTMKIESDELIDPLGTFDFEVRSHVHWIYIGLTIAAGLICGYFLKVDLQQRLELGQARLDARNLLARVAEEGKRHKDPAFDNYYHDKQVDLEKACEGTSPEAINKAKTELDTVWRKALQDFAKQHQDEVNALDKLRGITDLDWPVPDTVGAAILGARTAVVEVSTLIESDDLTKAKTRRDQAVLDLGIAVLEAASGWQNEEKNILLTLQKKPNGISQDVSTALDKPAQDLAASLIKISLNTTLVKTPEQIKQVLDDVTTERLWVQQFVNLLTPRIKAEMSLAQTEINRANLQKWDADAFVELQKVVDEFLEYLESTVDAPKSEKMDDHLIAVHQAWTDALQKQFTTPNPNVQTKLDSRNYVEAAKTTIQELHPSSVVALSHTVAAAPFLAPTFRGYASGLGAAPTYVSRMRFQTLFTSSPTQPTPFTLENQLRKDKSVQSAVLGLLLIVAGYGLQLNTFVGTFTEFSTLFFWAFGLDLTVDAIRGVAKKNS